MNRSLLYRVGMLAGVLSLASCNDDGAMPGNPTMDIVTEHADALFGDSLLFTVKATDADVPLSTLKAKLFFGEEQVSETVIRTKMSGQDYTGKIYIPYLKNVPDGTAMLVYVLQNINFTVTTDTLDLVCRRPDFPSLTLVGEDGQEYVMNRTGKNQYAVNGAFPAKMNAYIKAPKVGEYGNEMTFGYDTSNEITQGSTSFINFSNAGGGTYDITFNTLTYEAGPFLSIKLNGEEMESAGTNIMQLDMTLQQGGKLVFDGIPDYEQWWIDPDFFSKETDGTLKFLPISGNYRIIADMEKQYFKVGVLDASGNEATLQTDGTGVLYVVGGSGKLGTEAIGKPSTAGAPSWNADQPLVMAPVESKKYQLTVVAGKQISADGVNFKFYGGKGWANEYKSDRISSVSNLLTVNPGPSDDGNVWLQDGVTLEYGATYVITVDMTDPSHAVLDMVKTADGGEVALPSLNGMVMQPSGEGFVLETDLTQGDVLAFAGVEHVDAYWPDPDFFSQQADGKLDFLPVSGSYRIIVDQQKQMLRAVRLADGNPADLDNTGHGALWLLGWGVGSPDQGSQFGWDMPGGAYGMAEVSPNVYQFTGKAGPEKESSVGDRIRFDYLSFKIYKARTWDTELKPEETTLNTSLLKFTDGGNLELAEDVTLDQGTEYVLTVDLTAGITQAVVRLEKK